MARVDLAHRVAALATAVSAGEGRLPAGLLDDARAVLEHTARRSALSAEHTVVALAGSTGSGKSSLFNAIAREPLARPGITRPTTSRPWRSSGARRRSLLSWLEVGERHHAANRTAVATDGLVLLDLPDHDSVVTEHRAIAERLVDRVDLLVWVVDPQKYADAALHERYLRPLAGHGDVVVVVLNQIDRLTPQEAAACLADLRRLVAEDGLAAARVLGSLPSPGRGSRSSTRSWTRRRRAGRQRSRAWSRTCGPWPGGSRRPAATRCPTARRRLRASGSSTPSRGCRGADRGRRRARVGQPSGAGRDGMAAHALDRAPTGGPAAPPRPDPRHGPTGARTHVAPARLAHARRPCPRRGPRLRRDHDHRCTRGLGVGRPGTSHREHRRPGRRPRPGGGRDGAGGGPAPCGGAS
ncbi:GTPase [Oerskovia sp. M15]